MAIEAHWWEDRWADAGQLWVEADGHIQWEWELWLPAAVRVRRVVCVAAWSHTRQVAGAAAADLLWPLSWQFQLHRFEPPGDWTRVSEQVGVMRHSAAVVPGDPPAVVGMYSGAIDLVNVQRDDGAVGEGTDGVSYKGALRVFGFGPMGGSAGFVGRFAWARTLRVYFEQESA